MIFFHIKNAILYVWFTHKTQVRYTFYHFQAKFIFLSLYMQSSTEQLFIILDKNLER